MLIFRRPALFRHKSRNRMLSVVGIIDLPRWEGAIPQRAAASRTPHTHPKAIYHE